jgi:hypothetical protein
MSLVEGTMSSICLQGKKTTFLKEKKEKESVFFNMVAKLHIIMSISIQQTLQNNLH